MPIKVETHRNGRVLVFTMADPLTMDEFASAVLEHEPYMDEHRPHAIIDAMQLTRIPSNMLSFIFQETNTGLRMSTPGMSYTALVTRSQTLRTMTGVTRHLIPSDKITICNSMEDAWVYIDGILAEDNLKQDNSSE